MADNTQPGGTGTPEGRAETARDGVVSAREKFQRLSDDVQQRYRTVSEDVRRGAERATGELRRGAEAARERYDETAESVREGYTKIKGSAGDLTREVNGYVRENPGKSVLIAAGVGFLLGLLVRGRGGDDV